MIEVGVFGSTGYVGGELVRLLARHDGVHLRFAASASLAGRRLTDVYPTAPPVDLVHPDDAPLEGTQVVFLCLGHGMGVPLARRALSADSARVVDLSADFRLRDAATWSQWYGAPHAAPELTREAVYGLTEWARAALPGARLVANPGCYPTSILLALQPLVRQGALAADVIADAKSGVSGAGRTPTSTTHFVEVAGNCSPYAIGRTHRHLPEMEQALAGWNSAPPRLIFSPHLLPVARGLLSTIYAPLRTGWTEAAVRGLYADVYSSEPFVRLLPPGEVATLAHAVGTNRCVIGLTFTDGWCVLTSAIDNLIKGAAGQAVQNMNVLLGLEETRGLL